MHISVRNAGHLLNLLLRHYRLLAEADVYNVIVGSLDDAVSVTASLSMSPEFFQYQIFYKLIENLFAQSDVSLLSLSLHLFSKYHLSLSLSLSLNCTVDVVLPPDSGAAPQQRHRHIPSCTIVTLNLLSLFTSIHRNADYWIYILIRLFPGGASNDRVQ